MTINQRRRRYRGRWSPWKSRQAGVRGPISAAYYTRAQEAIASRLSAQEYIDWRRQLGLVSHRVTLARAPHGQGLAADVLAGRRRRRL